MGIENVQKQTYKALGKKTKGMTELLPETHDNVHIEKTVMCA